MLHAEITAEAPLTLSNLFVQAENEAPLLTSSIGYTFSGIPADSINYVRLCIATDNTCGTCVQPYQVITQGTPVPYSTTGTLWYISPAAIYAYLTNVGLGAGSYNIGLYVQSQSMNCSSGAAWCSTNSDSAGSPHNLCIQATSDGSSVTALSHSDNGQAQLNVSSKPYVFVAENFANILSCPVNSDGTLATCATTGGLSGQCIGTAVNPAGTKVYIAMTIPNTVTLCSVNANTGVVSGCANTGSVTGPQGIALNPAGTIAYISNSSNFVMTCPVNSNGTLGTCVFSGATGLSSPQGIAINASNTFAYIVSTNSNIIRKCAIGNGGSLSGCATIGSGFFNQPYGIAINKAGTFAYVVNSGSALVTKCPINPNGTFGTCADSGASGTPFSKPEYIALNKDGTRAYITNNSSTSASICVVNPDGTFGTCSRSPVGSIISANGISYAMAP